MLSSQALPPLITSLNPSSNPPKLILCSLRTLNTILDTATSSSASPAYAVATALYTPEVLRNICKIISQTSSSSLVQQQISLAASLIAKSCGRYVPMNTSDNGGDNVSREGAHEQLLVETGVLDSLSARLGSFVVAEKPINKSTKSRGEPDTPPPAPQSAKLAPILDAISVIIKDSKLRSLEFLFSPPLTALFPLSPLNSNSSDVRPSSSNKHGEAVSGSTTSIKLPQSKSTSSSIIQPPQLLITPSAFPPLTPSSAHFPPLSASTSHGSADYPSLHHYTTQHYHHHSMLAETPSMLLGSGGGGDDSESSTGGDTPLRQRAETAELEDQILRSSILETASVSGGEADIEVEESPLIPWLISQVRSGDPITRLMAASVLTNLFKVGLIGKRMAQLLVLLVLPVLVRLLNEDEMLTKVSVGVGGVDSDTWEKWTIQERAPAVLARLVMDSPEMQKAAVDAGAIKRLAVMLRRAAEPPASTSMNGVANGDSVEAAVAEKSKRNSPEVTHRMKVKQGTFRCLGSLAIFKDEYRKFIIDAGVVPMVVSSMKPLEPIPNALITQETTVGEGNPPPVLIAACGVVRALSRSVSILRTSLIDAGVAMPLFALLRHDDIEVRVSSTAAVCNLVLDFSPMRQSMVDAGVLEVLCLHTKSENASLRLNALWALKHLILDAESGVKEKCLEELGMDWLVGVISGDIRGEELGEDEEMAESEGGDIEGEGAMEDSIGDLRRLGGERTNDEEYYDAPEERTRPKTRRLPPKAAAVMAQLERREPEELTMRRKQTVAMQEQGLDLIRNLICNKGRTEMMDLLFESMGKDRLFGVLEEKLRPKTVRRRTGGGTTLELPPGEVVSSIVYILAHIAVGNPSHRQILIQRTELLRLLSSLWNHRLPKVRSGLAWVVINLTWIEESEDHEKVRSRTKELIRLGFEKSLEGMLHDSELDVRERAKTARYQMERAMQSEQGP